MSDIRRAHTACARGGRVVRFRAGWLVADEVRTPDRRVSPVDVRMATPVDRGFIFATLNLFAGDERARAVYERAGYTPQTIRYARELATDGS
jgi:membrane protein YdbS with pleckstrin-like domain